MSWTLKPGGYISELMKSIIVEDTVFCIPQFNLATLFFNIYLFITEK